MKLKRSSFLFFLYGFYTQHVYLNGMLSNSKRLNCGVPQGSCLRLLLFSIFTNDLPLVSQNPVWYLYTLYYLSTIRELHSVLSKDMDVVFEWVKSNRMVLNTKEIII